MNAGTNAGKVTAKTGATNIRTMAEAITPAQFARLEKKVDKLLKLLDSGATGKDEWITEAEVMKQHSLTKSGLRGLRTQHPDIFRYRAGKVKQVDTIGRTIRRGIQYNKTRLSEIYQTVKG